MPTFEIELHDGRKFHVDADTQPSEAEVMQAIGGRFQNLKGTFIGRGQSTEPPNIKQMGAATLPSTLIKKGIESAANYPVQKLSGGFAPDVELPTVKVPPIPLNPMTGPAMPGTFQAGVERGLSNLASGFIQPEQLPLLAATPLRPVQALFALGGAEQTPEAVQNLIKARTAQERGEAGVDVVGNLLVAGGLAREGLREPRIPEQPIGPETGQTAIPTIEGGIGPVRDVLGRIAENPQSRLGPYAAELLARRGQSSVMDQPINVARPEEQSFFQGGRIEINPAHVGQDMVVLHEVTHALTDKASPEVKAQLNDLFNEVKAQAGGEQLHGLTRPEEFLTEALTNPSFQQWLRFQRTAGRSLADRTIDLMYSLAGRARVKGSRLAQMEPLMERALEPNEPLEIYKQRPEVGPERQLIDPVARAEARRAKAQEQLRRSAEEEVGTYPLRGMPFMQGPRGDVAASIGATGTGEGPAVLPTPVEPRRQISEVTASTLRQQEALEKQRRAQEGQERGPREGMPFVSKEKGQGSVSGQILYSGSPMEFEPENPKKPLEVEGPEKEARVIDASLGALQEDIKEMDRLVQLRAKLPQEPLAGTSDDVIRRRVLREIGKLKEKYQGFEPRQIYRYARGLNKEDSLYSGAPIKPEDLRPAIRVGERLLVGEVGETHGDVLRRNGIDDKLYPVGYPGRGFVVASDPTTLISRKDAQSRSGLKGTNEVGGLDSMDLPGAGTAQLLRSSGFNEKEIQDAIRELRTSAETQGVAREEEEITKLVPKAEMVRSLKPGRNEQEGVEFLKKESSLLNQVKSLGFGDVNDRQNPTYIWKITDASRRPFDGRWVPIQEVDLNIINQAKSLGLEQDALAASSPFRYDVSRRWLGERLESGAPRPEDEQAPQKWKGKAVAGGTQIVTKRDKSLVQLLDQYGVSRQVKGTKTNLHFGEASVMDVPVQDLSAKYEQAKTMHRDRVKRLTGEELSQENQVWQAINRSFAELSAKRGELLHEDVGKELEVYRRDLEDQIEAQRKKGTSAQPGSIGEMERRLLSVKNLQGGERLESGAPLPSSKEIYDQLESSRRFKENALYDEHGGHESNMRVVEEAKSLIGADIFKHAMRLFSKSVPRLAKEDPAHLVVGFADQVIRKTSIADAFINKAKEEQSQGIKLYSGAPIESAVQKARDEFKKATPLILGNKDADPLTKKMGWINQPGETLSTSKAIQNRMAPLINAAVKADMLISPADVVYDSLDGGKGKYNGPLMNGIRKPLDDRFNDALNLEQSEGKEVRDLLTKYKINPTQSERIDVYLKSIQQGGRERMIESGVRPAVIDKILKSLTPAEKQVAQAMLKFYERSYPTIAKVAKDADGVTLKKVSNYSPWHRDWGKFQPSADELATNPRIAGKDNVSVDDVLWLAREDANKVRTTPGSLISRKPEAKTPIKLDAVGTFQRYLRDYSHYVSMRQFLKDAAKVVRSDEFRETYGDMGQDLIMEHLNTVARQGRYNRNQFIDTLRRMVGRGVIAYRIPSQLVHLANVPLAQQRAGPIWHAYGLHQALTPEGQAFLQKNFAETFARGGGEPALVEISQQHARTPVGKLFNQFSKTGFWVQRGIDQLNAQATVLGVYMKELESKGKDPTEYLTLPVDKAAIQQARVLSRRAVASPIYKDVPLALSKGSMIRSLTQFQNTFLDQWSNIRHDLPQYIRDNPRAAAGLTFALATMMLVETGIKFGYRQGLNKLAGQKKDDETFTDALVKESLRRVPGMGQLTAATVYGESGVPSLDVALEPGRQVVKAVKADDEARRVMSGTKAVTSIAEGLGVPGASQVGDIAQALERRKYFQPHIDRLEKQAGKKVEDMSLVDRAVEEGVMRQTTPKLSPESSAASAARAVKNNVKRGTDMQKTLSKADRGWLESRGLYLPGFDNKVTIGGQKVYLTEKEMTRYSELVKVGYESAIQVLRQQYDKVEGESKQKMFSDAFSEARKAAREQLESELVSESEKNRKDRKFQMLK